ncbi:MAG: hypothetical protein LBU83_01555 [Bacteroidales bacterium]|jgi:hypothetical protein|nr:hypothetical protein [Bacteroidales bacterium]
MMEIDYREEFKIGALLRERQRLNVLLRERKRCLNEKFIWTDEARERILKLNQKIFDCEKLLYEEYDARKKELDERINANDKFLTDYNIDMKINLQIFLLDEDGEWTEPSHGIYSVLNDLMRKEAETIATINYFEDKEMLNWNQTIGSASEYFKDDFIHYAFHVLYSHLNLAWEDILKINWLDTEVCIDYQNLPQEIFENNN